MAYIKNATLQGDSWAAPGSVLIGNVTVGDDSSVWYNAVVRGDRAAIVIGSRTSVQDCTVVHADTDFPCHIGNGVTVGHGSIIHGCTIGDNTLIGMGSVIMNGAVVGRDCLIGAGSVVTQGKKIPDGMLALGSPAKVVRPLTEEEKKVNKRSSDCYVEMKDNQKHDS